MLLHLAISFQSDVGAEGPEYEEIMRMCQCQSIYQNTLNGGRFE